MIDLYPAIDLRGGRCVRLYQGDFSRETVYGDDPVAVARAYEDAGAPWIHVVDLDASRGQGSNRELVIAVAAAVSVPVQTGGGVRDTSLLDEGVSRIVLGSVAVGEPDLAARLIQEAPGQVAIGLDHWDGQVRVRGWEDGAGVELFEALAWPELSGAASFVVTNIARDATLEGPDLDGYRRLLEVTDTPVVASGGVGSLDDLRALDCIGVSGVIVGKALYEGRFDVTGALEVLAGP
ncbi:MAG TPA: 1-(5-phosphoribosyl)-5-[(5-phosphoribosylamino)methylideneamino] imidazole-4-carboxamide isomerase [Acidimicrobiales bacterium]|nr:1-(5-phosphoribosyl)-5-[(5-phosphoribosylamino)methylideneamino] imidazole-4-carboxamide isomerase [Acidimicrobiales bacterium]